MTTDPVPKRLRFGQAPRRVVAAVLTRLRPGRAPRRIVAAVLAGLAVLSTVVATISWGVASARDDT